MSRPDFIIVGAMKCGTTTLSEQLGLQPGIFMTTPKEPNFFSDDDVFAKGPDWYATLFADAEPGDIRGEASTHYTKLPTYPDCLPRLKAALPDLRLIYLIRNPVARAVSHYIHEWSMRTVSEDIATALDRMPEITAYGEYARQITPFVEAYGKENVLLLTLEGMKAAPQTTLEKAAAFIGHGQPVTWDDASERANASDARVRRFKHQKLLIEHPVAAALRRALVPKSVRNWVRARRQMQSRPELPDSTRRRLEEVYEKDHARLAALFPEVDLTATYPFLK